MNGQHSPLYLHQIRTPHGSITLGEIAGELRFCSWDSNPRLARIIASLERAEHVQTQRAETEPLQRAGQEVSAYLLGETEALTLPFRPVGTPFQRRVWSALTEIPAGEVRTYTEVAQHIGQPTAIRAVASACAMNPLHLFVPCHRVVPKGKDLGAYAGGSELKRWLLSLESLHYRHAR